MKSHIAEAIAVLADLPEERQAMVACAILDFAAEETGVYQDDDEERAEVLEGFDDIMRGDLASDADIAQAYRRLGL